MNPGGDRDADRAATGGEAAARGMAMIGLTVSALAALAPRTLARVYRIPPDEMTGLGALGWRLFAARTAYVSVRALSGDPSARGAFLPLQILDQAAFAHARSSKAIPPIAATGAMLTSGAIIALDLLRRRGLRRTPGASRSSSATLV